MASAEPPGTTGAAPSLLCSLASMASTLDLEIRPLRASEVTAIHELVLDAFTDYPVPMQPSREQFAGLLAQRGIDWAASLGAFTRHGELIAASLTALESHGSELRAYAILHAVRRDWQGRGVLGELFNWLELVLGQRKVARMQLEVLVDNPPARRSYQRLGFETTRHLLCMHLPPLRRAPRLLEPLTFEQREGGTIAETLGERSSVWASWWSLVPAWTNSLETVARSSGTVLVEASWGGQPCGYALVRPDSGELVQIAVDPELRRRGIGTELVRAAQAAARKSRLRVINVDDSDDDGATVAFFRRLGGELFAVQLEMMRVDPHPNSSGSFGRRI